MLEPTERAAARCHHDSPYCSRCDLLVGLDGLHVTAVESDDDVGLLTVHVESARTPMGCATCGVVAHSHARSDVSLVDAPCFDRPVRLIWRKRTWRCEEPACPTKAFTEQDSDVAAPRALLTTREVLVAWLCAQHLRAAYKASSAVEGRRIAQKVLASFPTCPIPEIKRLGRTLKQWREAFLAYFDTGRASNGGTEAMNGLIELHRRVARSFRNREHYRLRMLLIGGGLSHPHLR